MKVVFDKKIRPVIFFVLFIFMTGFFTSMDPEDELSWAEKTLSQMSLREKIAQMIVSYSNGYALEDGSEEFLRLKKLIEEDKIGGIIFFKGNTIDQPAVINRLQSLSEIPMLISADFERGTAMRLDDGSQFPNNMALGAADDSRLAYEMGYAIGIECRALGVHQNYAPVVDVNNNPNNPIINVRSFGEDPKLISRLGDAMIKGLQDAKTIATAKHFPGHGDTDIDSHSDLPVINFGKDRLDSVELVPFRSAVDNAGVMSVMIAHLSFPALDNQPNVPSSLSANIVEDLLINEIGFDGLIVTDALNMKGITKYFSTEEVALMCINAGIDLILMPQGESLTIETIENAVKNGTVSEERIDRSVIKILEAKEWLGLDKTYMVDLDMVPQLVNTIQTQELAQKIADASITLVKNENDILPFDDRWKEKSCLVVSLDNSNAPLNAHFMSDEIVKNSGFAKIDTVFVAGELESPEELLSMANKYDVIVIPIFARVRIFTGTVGLPESQLDFINKLTLSNKEVVVLSMGNPYLIQGFTGVNSYVCAYGESYPSIKATVKAITGKIGFNGKLPITISSEFPAGTGLK